jgi:integrase
MARRIKDRDLDSRDARLKLKARGKPYWRSVGKGLHLGYRKGKRGGVWVVRRYLGDQAYKVETIAIADDTEDADGKTILDFWQAQEAARNSRPTASRRLGAYTVKDAIDAYIEHLGDKPSAYDAKLRLRAFAIPAFGDKPVAELSADEIRKWHRWIAKMPARARTKPGEKQAYRAGDLDDPETARKRQTSANRCLSWVKAALNHAWAEKKATGIESRDEWMRVKPFEGVDIARSRHLTPAECKRLINAAEGDFRNLVHAALQTGARYSELARLRVADFNRDNGTLHIRESKTNKDRHIILTAEGREFFIQLTAGRAGSELLLGRDWKKANQSEPMKAACKRAKIDPPIGFHGLRHSWASLSVMNGAELMVVAKNLGHSDTRMVEKHYGHLADGYVKRRIRETAPSFGMVKPSNVVGAR